MRGTVPTPFLKANVNPSIHQQELRQARGVNAQFFADGWNLFEKFVVVAAFSLFCYQEDIFSLLLQIQAEYDLPHVSIAEE